MSLHDIIHSEILKDPEPFLRATGSEFQIQDLSMVMNFLFRNYRHSRLKGHQGMSLSYPGHCVLKKYFETYVIDKNYHIGIDMLMKLDKKMNMPYYLGTSKIHFYSAQDCAWIQLCGGELSKFLKNI